MSISELSIKRPIYVVVLFILVAVIGLIGYMGMKEELMPKFTPPTINVQVIYPGASPTEVESSLTRKLEDALSSLEGIETIRSYSFESMSMIFVSFTYGTDIDKTMTQAQNAISSKKAELPSAILSPMINKITVDNKSIMTLSARSDMDANEFYDLIDKRIAPDFLRIKGMAKAVTVGGAVKEIQINLDMEKMKAFGVSPIQVQGVLRGANLDFPTGSIKNPETTTSIRLSGKLQSVEEIAELSIFTLPNGTQIRMRDIADVSEMDKDALKIARVDGEDAVLINIFKQGDANAIEVSDAIRERIAQFELEYSAQNLKIDVCSDTTDFTRASIKAVLVDLFLAILLVTIVILLFLHNFRNALIVMVVVPLSLIGAFIGMMMFDFSLNLMSLLGLSVVIGVLVDDAIVVIENVYRHIEMKKDKLTATLDAMKEIGFTVISVTIVLVIVFLPIALTNTLVSDIMRQFCGVIIFSILFSLLAALTLVPLLTSRYGNLTELTGKNIFEKFLMWFEKIVQSFGDWIAGVTSWTLKHKGAFTCMMVALTVAVFALFPLGFVGFEFMPDVDQSEFTVVLEMPKDISMEESSALVLKAEEWLRAKPEVTNIITMVGITTGENESTQGTAYLAELSVRLVPPSEREDVNLYIAKIQKPLTDYLVDAKVNVYGTSLHGASNAADIEYVITGNDPESVSLFAEEALAIMEALPGTRGQKLSVENATPEISVEVDRDKMSALGLSLDNVGFTMQLAFQGSNSIKYVEGEYEYDINIRADKFYRGDIKDVESLAFTNMNGETIRLDQFAQVNPNVGPNRLERYNRNRSVTISSQVIGLSAGEVSAAFLEKAQQLNQEKYNGSIVIQTAGDMKSMMDSMGILGGALLLSIILIYLALVVLYNNWRDPFAVMFSIPFSILGAILALALTNTSLSIYGALGLVMLIGLVAKNAILLVDFANEQITEGMDIDEAVISAVRLRTRPILMTALSTIIGMIPVALGSGSGAELRNGLGWVIIGGMALSTFLTLIVVPMIYRSMHKSSVIPAQEPASSDLK